MVSGIRHIGILGALAAAGALAGGADILEPRHERPPEPDRDARRAAERDRLERRRHEERAWERKQRRRAADELREQMLRERIAKGVDSRDDKYLHSAARRRRAAHRAKTEA